MPWEVEVKLAAPDLQALRQRLQRRGGRLAVAETLEKNWLFDDGTWSLRRRGCLLRLRRWGEATFLTFKGEAAYHRGIKQRLELETSVGDAQTMEEIFRWLGWQVVFMYEKRREEWELEGVRVCLDCTPMGSFVELEGEEGALKVAAEQLQLDLSQALRGSYWDLWQAFRQSHPHAPFHMVFAP